MDLLTFARGPALNFALVVFCLGVLWRLTAVLLLKYREKLSPPRNGVLKSIIGGIVATGMRSWPHKEFIGRTGYGELLGYSYHIGLFIVILAFGPHIEFFKSLFGVSWPAMGSGIINLIAIITVALMLAVFVRRLTHRVMRKLSNFDDYFSWFVTILVLLTGLMASAHFGAPYETLLAWHILSFDLLLIWYPFGKLMHSFYIFPLRGINGYLFTRKGAQS